MSEPSNPAGNALIAASPLAHHWRPGRHGAAEPDVMTISERRLAIVQLTARKDQVEATAAALASVTGLDLPQPGHTSSARDLMAVWAQPNSWLLMQPLRPGPSLPRVLDAACGGVASIVDLTGGRAVLRLAGGRVRDVLAKGCRIDLHPRAFGPGRSAMTVIGHVETVVIQIDEAPTFDLIVPATYAASFLDWLERAAEEWGYELI